MKRPMDDILTQPESPMPFAQRNIEFVLIACLVLALGAAAHQRNLVWDNDISLWSDVVEKSPRKFRGHNNLGEAYAKLEQYDRAMAALGRLCGLAHTSVREAIQRAREERDNH